MKDKRTLIPYKRIVKIFAFDRFPCFKYSWKPKKTFLGFVTQKEGWYEWDGLMGETFIGETLPDSVLERYLVENEEIYEFPGVRIVIDGASNIEIPKKDYESAKEMVKEVKNRMREIGIDVLDTGEFKQPKKKKHEQLSDHC